MVCSQVLTPQNKLEPPGSKVFKPIAILKIYPHFLFPKLSKSPLTLVLKLSNLPHLNKIDINMSLSIQI